MRWTEKDVENRLRVLEMFRDKLQSLILVRKRKEPDRFMHPPMMLPSREERANEEEVRRHTEEEARRHVNELIVPAKKAILDAGVEIPKNHSGPLVMLGCDPFTHLFRRFSDNAMIEAVADCTDRAIGFYRLIRDDPSMNFSATMNSMEIRTSISRALRLGFQSSKPNKEKDVQDAIEMILTTIGVSFTRDKEAVDVGGKSYKPDFVIESEGMVIEVKLAKDGHGISKIQEQIGSDIHGYQQKWPRVLFVIYDLGTIKDPEKIRISNEKTRGVFVEIVKH